MLKTSRYPGFYKLSVPERRAVVVELSGLPPGQARDLTAQALTPSQADLMIENVVGTHAFPLGVAVNFRVDDQDTLVPMAIEEPSVVAAASNMARVVRQAGGFHTQVDPSVMIGQVQVTRLPDPGTADRLRAALPQLHALATQVHPQLPSFGGGLRELQVRELRYDEPGEVAEDILVLHFHLDCADAMGANMVNTVAERLAPEVARITGGKVGLRILSNLASERLARARCAIPAHLFDTEADDGRQVVQGIASAYRFAWADPWRAATHNKGVMNGIDAVALATGNDWRAIEAGAHAWAARDGQYRSLTSWKVDQDHVLHGQITLPMQVGTVGGTIRSHPTVRTALGLMGDPGARRLAGVMASVGLAQNLGALRALATEGIQQGHMRLHARSLAVQAGAKPDEVQPVAQAISADRQWTVEAARAVIERLRR